MTKVWLYSVASLFSLGVLLAARHLAGGAAAQFMGESIGLVIVLLSCQICFHLNGIDELLVDSKPQVFIQKILKSAGAGLLIAALLFYIFPRLSPGYAAAAASACFLMFGLVVLRPFVRSFGRIDDDAGTVIVGSEEMVRKLYSEIVQRDAPENIQIIGYEDLGRFAQQQQISRVVVADRDIQPESTAAQTLIDLKLRGVRIESALESFEKVSRKIWVEGLSPDRLIFADGFCPSKIYLGCKRAVDVLLAVLLLLIAAPLMALIAIVVKLETTGPAIFSQERVGLLGRRFIVYKFRSMRRDAERKTGPTWAKENDDRITRVGAFLRKSRFDELPQVWNVLCGDMSFIGPRPERPYFVDMLKSKIRYYDLRHYVKPGITGWAQVMYPYGASIEDAYHKLQYDLYYTKNISLRLDLLILLKTIKVVAAGQGR
ncbi:MAG TPA: exopolysaccharide biosynthesis polyprenyl glycosylphosphotransferase [Terriglobia bacterium]|nr:exopolysaccharide biosynthesis polyprenyl glycosylphosphotransferase [Terriglobia bacterium]